MPLPEQAWAEIERWCADRTPETFRDKMRVTATCEGNKVTLFEGWKPPDADRWLDASFAGLRYVQSRGIWKVYWIDSNDRWLRYDPLPEARLVRTVLLAVEDDPLCVFFG